MFFGFPSVSLRFLRGFLCVFFLTYCQGRSTICGSARSKPNGGGGGQIQRKDCQDLPHRKRPKDGQDPPPPARARASSGAQKKKCPRPWGGVLRSHLATWENTGPAGAPKENQEKQKETKGNQGNQRKPEETKGNKRKPKETKRN